MAFGWRASLLKMVAALLRKVYQYLELESYLNGKIVIQLFLPQGFILESKTPVANSVSADRKGEGPKEVQFTEPGIG